MSFLQAILFVTYNSDLCSDAFVTILSPIELFNASFYELISTTPDSQI